ncbi:hypothetical protein JJJ17_02280 [Paracoccus caeni]|uniref:Uncharacterized protein n=1 Tax=Paracoccus caeni TaxID=657651 RepID=A0A934S9Q3_9RHOB|nr:hypothetical protein [Paracoccus caeni]MBK4214746.1 hypothetical protein [Paracoccus caeni]
MIAQFTTRAPNPRIGMQRLLDRHGTMPVLLALIRALLLPRRRRPRPPDPYHLSPHMRRDIGLPPIEPYVPKYFDLR